MKRLLKNIVLLLVLLGAAGFGASWYRNRDKSEAVSFRSTSLKRGDMVATIGATGTVEPEEVIDVGAQVAGRINSFGKDSKGKSIDYGSEVEEGTILAQIDDSIYKADVALATAQLRQAQAAQENAEANLQQLQAKLDQAQRDWTRAQKIGPSEALAQTSYDAYRSGFEVAKANIEVGKAAIDQAKASVSQAQAELERAERNLGYCTIKSPVKGVIIDRRVNIGQTVVASLNAPSLFLLAKDLRRMQVWVSVNEADIGSIHAGQPVSFTADAFPDESFRGEVGKVRLNATMTQNVVTYTVEVVTDNSTGKLLPYLTANVQFELARRDNVLMVPNGALRWTPQPKWVATDSQPVSQESGTTTAEPKHRQKADGDAAAGKEENRGTVWVPEGNYVRAIHVRIGLTDGTMTEIEGEGLKEGIEVILGEQQPQAEDDTATTNPFLPQIRRNRPAQGR